MADGAQVIECACGAILDGKDAAEVIANAQSHAKATHDMELSEEQARSMARPA